MAPKILPDTAYLRQCFVYDAASGLLMWSKRPLSHFLRDETGAGWNTRYAGTVAGGLMRRRDYPRHAVMLNGSTFITARVIWKMETGRDPIEIDHKDRNALNNRWDNLREASRFDNAKNRQRIDPTPLPYGVRQVGGRFYAYLRSDGKHHYLGAFATKESAAQAAIAGARRLHGDFSAH